MSRQSDPDAGGAPLSEASSIAIPTPSALLTLRLFTPSTAAAPDPGEKVAVTFTFSGKVKKK